MRTYDLIFSLGANCSAAHNLQIRNLRPFSLPLDWVYFTDESTLWYLAAAVKTRLADLMLRENLAEITPNNPEWMPSHQGFLKFLDTRSGYRFVNHFRLHPSCKDEYERVRRTLRRRINRLFAALEQGHDFLLVLGTRVLVSEETLVAVQDAFLKAFPGKRFDMEVLQFNAPEESEHTFGKGIRVHTVRRDWNAYDTERTNWEWRFLDDVKTHTKPKRSKIAFHVLPHLKMTISWLKC